MLAQRILFTLQLFDLQNTPLTLLEVYKFLLRDKEAIKVNLDAEFEYSDGAKILAEEVDIYDVLTTLNHMLAQGIIAHEQGYYSLPGRQNMIPQRLHNYFFAIMREKLTQRFGYASRYVPFIRSLSLAGSQVLGEQKPESDIDLLIITDPSFLWLGRTFLTLYFHILGLRRHGKYIANRFCLNHYLARPKTLENGRNIYTALEYYKLRPLFGPVYTAKFQERNKKWIEFFFPHASHFFAHSEVMNEPFLKRYIELLFRNRFGQWLERATGQFQHARIKEEKFIVVHRDELSFHPESKQDQLLQKFFAQ